MRNALAHAGKNGRRVVSAFIATAFAQNDADAARRQWRAVADQLRPKMAKLATFMDEAEPDVLAYMSFPAQHRAKLHGTNPLEQNDEWAVQRSRYMTLEPKAGEAKRSPPSAMMPPSPACRTWRPEYAAHIGAPRWPMVSYTTSRDTIRNTDPLDGCRQTGTDIYKGYHQTGLERYSGRSSDESGTEWVSWSRGPMVGAASP
jgi:hypothetical protein